MNKEIKAVIFDMGGALLKTVDPQPRIALARRFGTSKKELETFVFESDSSRRSEVGEISDKEHWQAIFDHYKVQIPDYLSVYEQFFSGDSIDEEVLSYAISLKSSYQLGLLSNAWANSRSFFSTHYRFIEAFDVSIFSSEVGCRKPEPRIFHEILKRLNISAQESLFIDDFSVNVERARAVGMHAVRFTSGPDIIKKVNSILKQHTIKP
ncbi:MAG: HAD family phosphatase [Anaerolineaceae bacterium]|nr:HAD family phosphatase [Anaerolineaceae bacterium]